MNVLITGTSSGLGLALAQTYLEQGATVYGSARRPSPIEHANFTSSEVDIANFDELNSYLETLKVYCPSFDLVILNAGILGEIADMKDASIEQMKETMDINLWSNKVILDSLLEVEVKQVVAISSGVSVSGNRGWNGYSLSKAALNMLVKLYASENEEVHFTAFAPGLVDTRMQDQICSMEEIEKYSSIQRIQSARGTETMPTPEELAKKLPEAFEKLKSIDNGSFVDIRKM